MYYGVRVNLATPDTAYNLAALLKAADPKLDSAVRPLQFHTIILNTDGASNVVLVGDENISTSRYGYSIPTTGTLTLFNENNILPLADLWVQSGGTDLKLNVTLVG